MAEKRTKDLEINIQYITRVEGHGNIVVNARNGILEQCDLEIVESPRFFEAMLKDQPYAQAPTLSSRICGICAVAHSTTSHRAVEKALDVKLSPQTELLRKLNYHGEMLDSHILHVYMLVAPDYLGVGSVIPLVKSAPDVVLRALRMKKLAGDICAAICGRHTHPVGMTIGGFTNFPSKDQLLELKTRLVEARADIDATVELFQGLKFPDFKRDTEYIALSKDGEYCFIDGQIKSTDGGTWPIEDYRKITNEYQVQHSSAKHARNQRKSYMVGALARFNINYDHLHPRAKAAAAALKLQPKCTNPYLNPAAQVVEIVHCVEDAILLIDRLVETGVRWEEPAAPQRYSGDGAGGCEAPRGILFHEYSIKSGYITEANCIIPTGQNLANIEADMRSLVPTILNTSEEHIAMQLEMLVRAYDPCISCSSHMLEIKFV